jgi:hypothetical protein
MTEKEIRKYYQTSKYFVTGIKPIFIKYKNKKVLSYKDNTTQIHCLGWYNTLEKAQEHTLSNCMDLSEDGYYKYIVIEKVPEGVYPISKTVSWYKWTDKYIKCRKPLWAKNIINWSIG